MSVDFPLSSLVQTLRRLTERDVPHAARLLKMVEEDPHLRWSALSADDQSIVRGWRLHLVGMMRRVQDQLQEVKRIMALASAIEKANPFLGGQTSSAWLRISEFWATLTAPMRFSWRAHFEHRTSPQPDHPLSRKKLGVEMGLCHGPAP